MQMFYEDEQVSMFAPDSCAGKMSPAHSPAGSKREMTFGSSWKKHSELVYQEFMFLKITLGDGDILGQPYWEILSPYVGESSTLNTGVCPRVVRGSSLWQILEPQPQRKYYLSRKACLGILRRARKRGKELPATLKLALEMQSGLRMIDLVILAQMGLIKAYHINQRNEGIDLGDTAGALMATSNLQMQTFVASFSAGAGASAGGIGYREGVAPTLKAGSSGNSMPSVLCINDQGGERMDIAADISGTLRSQEYGHQPLIFENHGIDARYRAVQKQYASEDGMWRKLLDHLNGKELTSAGHLTAQNFSFSDEILIENGKLNFYVQADFDVDAAFGTFVCTDENNDWLNIYANYDIAQDRPCDTLELNLCKGDGTEENWSYHLNAAEQEVLARKMEAFCQQQNGMSLCDFARQLQEEPGPSPQIQM